jgi:hypothetical protein
VQRLRSGKWRTVTTTTTTEDGKWTATYNVGRVVGRQRLRVLTRDSRLGNITSSIVTLKVVR